MRKNYDFSNATRSPLIVDNSRERLTVMLDKDVLEILRERAMKAGSGYNDILNESLRKSLGLGPKK